MRTPSMHRSHVGHTASKWFRTRWQDLQSEPERGDVPGWVLITIMTAGLVAALWLVAEPLLGDLFTTAVTSVGR